MKRYTREMLGHNLDPKTKLKKKPKYSNEKKKTQSL